METRRRLIHRHDIRCAADAQAVADGYPLALQFRLDDLGSADQNDAGFGMKGDKADGSRHGDGNTVVPAHTIKRDGNSHAGF
jgi:hypothetical protein